MNELPHFWRQFYHGVIRGSDRHDEQNGKGNDAENNGIGEWIPRKKYERKIIMQKIMKDACNMKTSK